MPKHRAPRYVRTKKVLARAPVAAGATVVGIGVLSTPASAGTTHDWTGVARCESGGDWSINTGNGYYGGLQFSPATWAGFGGTALAPRADLATPAQQVQIAEEVLDGQGIGAWPTCGKHLTEGTTAAAAAPAGPAAPSAEPRTGGADDSGRHAAQDGQYTVRRGDTVARIAAAHGQTWRALYERNVDVVGADPDLIRPGQVLRTDGAVPAGTPAPAPAAPATPAAAPAPAAVTAAAVAPTSPAAPATVTITNSAGAVQPRAQAAADAVATAVPGVGDITIGGTRASAVDPHGHPSGLALDFMVGVGGPLGDAIVDHHLAHWDELGVDYLIWEQRILTSPTGAWKQMADRGGATANHLDHVHVNYRAA
jgi:Transglycosylase-like domain/LysM domain